MDVRTCNSLPPSSLGGEGWVRERFHFADFRSKSPLSLTLFPIGKPMGKRGNSSDASASQKEDEAP